MTRKGTAMKKSPLVFVSRQADIRAVFRLLSKDARRKFKLYLIIQITLNILDILSVAIMGAIGALALNGIQSKPSGNRVQFILQAINLDGLTFQSQVALLGIIAVLLMLFKVLLQYSFNKKILNLLFEESIKLSSRLLSDGIRKQTRSELRNTYHEFQHAIGYGINATTIGTLGVVSTLISDVFLLVLVGGLVFFVDPVSFFFSFIFFGALSYVLYKKQNNRAYELGKIQSELNVAGNAQLQNIFQSYREIYLNGKQNFFVESATELRRGYRDVFVTQVLFPNIGKYAVEVSVAIATLAMAAFQFSTQNSVHAAANLTIFLAAGSRIAPALLRIQNGMITLKGNLGQVSPTLELLSKIEDRPSNENYMVDEGKTMFIAKVDARNLKFQYSDSREFDLDIENLEIEPGKMVAIIGKSGSGKTTLVDLLLGLRIPQSGDCKISGISSRKAVEKWPGKVAYVPQQVEIFDGSIAENIAIGEVAEKINQERVIQLLRDVGLFSEIAGEQNGIWRCIDGKRETLSGGQRQRLGIARALYHEPSLIVLDEATSSLDAHSEHMIAKLFASLSGKVTVLAIAHRLSTVTNSDLVIYMENGRITASGTFEQLKQNIGDDITKSRILGFTSK
jgi:ABC-type bacteriocin/lantibiotic exporter with double-glycine peptidase domain